MADRPLILLHGYSADGSAFDRWRTVLRAAGWTAEQLCTVSYESLTNDVSVRDIAEGFDKVLRQRVGLADDEPFDVMVHSTGMLVLRAGLTRRGMTAPRRARAGARAGA
jgi:triacylglycerol esterase/lipase EstA (alpha/beta hydrolase family)